MGDFSSPFTHLLLLTLKIWINVETLQILFNLLFLYFLLMIYPHRSEIRCKVYEIRITSKLFYPEKY